MIHSNKFICPKCKKELFCKGGSLVCINGHSYDIAKEGYVNLHLTNKKSELIGDNKQMILARRDFLELGYYEKMANAITEAINKYVRKDATILDCGCGSGYYANIIKKNRQNYNDHMLGIDISKEGIKIAAKLNKEIDFAVASAFDLPLKNNSVDCLVSIFAPYAIQEIKRVVKKNGIVIFVYPNKYHLWELKKAIYGEETYEKDFTISFKDFQEIEQINLSYNFELKSSLEIANLITMTPYCYKTPKNLLEKAINLKNMAVKADFCIKILSNS